MYCPKCKTGSIEVHDTYIKEDLYRQRKDGSWKNSSKTFETDVPPHAHCASCKERYAIDLHKFYQNKEIVLFEKTEVTFFLSEGGKDPSATVTVDTKKNFSVLESAGWVPVPDIGNFTSLPGLFEKRYAPPKGAGIFGGLLQSEVFPFLEKSYKALSENGISYDVHVLNILDAL